MRSSIVLIAIILMLISLCESASEIDATYKRKLVDAAEGWQKIVLPADLYQHARSDLIDLRVLGLTAEGDTIEAAYLVPMYAVLISYLGIVAHRSMPFLAAGISSAFILKALERNGRGVLYSIDLPNYEVEYFKSLGLTPGAILPEGRESGFAVPESLRHRWVLRLGRTKEVLPTLLEEIDKVDVFLHDSEHTYDNMTFEYNTVWPYLAEGGLLISHDVRWNRAFDDFARSTRGRQFKPRCLGIGVIVK